MERVVAKTGEQGEPLAEMADFDKTAVTEFLGAVAQDPEAYGAITNSQRAFTTTLINDVFTHRSEYSEVDAAIKTAVHPGGEIAGILSEARAQGVFAESGHKQEEYVKGVEDTAKWINRGIDMAGAKYVEMFPIAGDIVGWLQEDITDSVVESAKKDITDRTDKDDEQAVLDYQQADLAAQDAAAAAVKKAAEGSGLSERDINVLAGVAATETGNAHAIGRGERPPAKG
ncbi:hypothetical protein [Streptomyces sp. NPDC002054]|uniref:hypothetical protein n=1 Tax=Streptomyces sp. NPDC002054 TaxID=3154663 RepID=UPI00332283F4